MGVLSAALDDIGEAGSIIVYSSYERRMLNELAKAFPQHEAELLALTDRLWDLLPIIQNQYYHPGFRGSFSIKSVLPALLPKEGWSDLELADGRSAVLMYEQALITEQESLRTDLFDALRAYCKQDTLAMFKVREALLID